MGSTHWTLSFRLLINVSAAFASKGATSRCGSLTCHLVEALAEVTVGLVATCCPHVVQIWKHHA